MSQPFSSFFTHLLFACLLLGTAHTSTAGVIRNLSSDGSCQVTIIGSGTGNEYRSYDGSCNNLETGKERWGAAGSDLGRWNGTAYYADGISSPGGANRPNPRLVSNTVVAQSGLMPNTRGVSAILMQWGQFLDHDLSLTHPGKSESFPIIVTNDPIFGSIYPNGEMPFNRSEFNPGTGTGTNNPRQQPNALTAFIDASQLYGSNSAEAANLRAWEGGKLKMEGGLLPRDTQGLFYSGDERAREQVGLTAMHTLFSREHNRLAGVLAERHPDWDDETLYQETRKVVGAMMQAITFNEFLPALLGHATPGSYGGYDPNTDPAILNEFSTAAFRFGHTTLSPALLRIDNDGTPLQGGPIALQDAFFTAETLIDADGIEPYLRGLASQRIQEIDPFIVDALRNLLFGPVGFDLAALNLQRGRDHGLPTYNQMREILGLERLDDWDSVGDNIFLEGVKDLLSMAYPNIDEIDLWVGGLSEAQHRDSLLGETFTTIIAGQFDRLRAGDRFWYENEEMFEHHWLDFIKSSTLGNIMSRNGIRGLSANVFFVPSPATLMLLMCGGLAWLVSTRAIVNQRRVLSSAQCRQLLMQ